MRSSRNSKSGPYQVVKSGSVQIKIYRIASLRSQSGWVYSAAWYEGGERRQKQSVDLDKLLARAKLKAEQLAAGRVGASELRVEDLELLNAASELIGDVPLLSALREWRRARELVGGDLIPACLAWSEKVAPSFERITVEDANQRFLAEKIAAKIETKVYNYVLPRLALEFGGLPIDKVTQQQLQKWLFKQANPVTRNSYRKAIVALWRWCRKAGYLPRDVQTAAEQTERAREEAPPVGIIDAKTYYAALCYIKKEHPHYLAQLLLAGFCGLRRVEVHQQLWEDINLERKFVRVSSAKKGTASRRLVPISEAAVEWLNTCAQPAGAVSPGDTWAMDRIRDILHTAKFKLPPNCFRHAFISHKVALTGDVNQTSLDAGNSPRIIHRHYRELVSPGEGADWFNIYPDGIKANVPQIENTKTKKKIV